MKEKVVNAVKSKYGKMVTVGTTLALPVLTFAAESGSGDATSSMLSEFTSLKGQAITAMTAVVGIAVGIFGFKWLFRTIKGFFKSSTGGN